MCGENHRSGRPSVGVHAWVCVCVHSRKGRQCVSYFRSAVLLNYLSGFYSDPHHHHYSPSTLLFPSLSQAKHLSFHSWLNLYSIEMCSWGGKWEQSPRPSRLFFQPRRFGTAIKRQTTPGTNSGSRFQRKMYVGLSKLMHEINLNNELILHTAD